MFEGGNIFVKELKIDNTIVRNGFVSHDFIVKDGIIYFNKDFVADTIIDISGKYVVPPFADAHTHNLDRPWQLSYLPQQYLKEGCFYVLNLTSKKKGVDKVKPFFDKKNTVDVRFSLQGLTSEIGHPFVAYEPFAMGLNDPAVWKDSLEVIKKSRLDEGNSYIFFNTIEEAQQKLPEYFAQNPDVVKIFLVESDQYEENAFDDIMGNNGLSPEVARYITEEAHEMGKIVYAHIANAKDFELAVAIGVDVSAHLPTVGWNGQEETRHNYIISDQLIEQAIAQRHSVITTLQLSLEGEDVVREKRLQLSIDFLKRYKKKGGKILIGSDKFGSTLLDELKLLAEKQVFTNYELLKIASVTTPQTIFSDRKIGFIQDGYEASFLIVNENPLISFETLYKPLFLMKQGNWIE